ncbi:MAG: toxin TcdB middle/N-terminal domain-containing protein, partial [Limisphaerales bacterium]
MRRALVIGLLTSSGYFGYCADKSGVSPNAISLPKGPGSVEGLGESFQPTLNTGTASYELELRVPAGTAGHAPALSIRYEGGGGNGPLGFGWSLPMAYVQRRTDRGIPVYSDEVGFAREDTFINEMREELVPTAEGLYFCKNEGAFIRYRQTGQSWTATAPNGTTMVYGAHDESRVQADAERVFLWMLDSQTDTRGNTILYGYTSFPGEQDLHQVYLKTIRYGAGAPPWSDYHFVTFEYEERSDWFEDCRSGFAVRTGKRLRSIIVGTHGPVLENHLQADLDGDGLVDNLVRRYEIDYQHEPGTDSHWSLLSSVTQVGSDGVSTLPPAVFGYQVCDPPEEISAAGSVMGSVNTPPWVMDNPLAELVDLNGDALPDLLKTESGGGIHTAYLNLGELDGDLQWQDGIPLGGDGDAFQFDLKSDASSGGHGSHLADMDGDGAADFTIKAGAEQVFYFSNLNKTRWGERQLMTVQDFAPPAPFGDPGVRIGDFDFDKRTDIMRSLGGNLGYHVWFNLGEQIYSPRLLAGSEGFSFDFSQGSVQVADMNGDRVPDIAAIAPVSVTVTAGLGYGRFQELRVMMIPDGVVLSSQQVARARLVDLNGDGLADLVVEKAEGTDMWFWINQGTYAFGARKRITGLPVPIGSNAQVRWADLNGNGTSDYVLADAENDPSLQTVDIGNLLSCGASPNVLISISNGIGRVTEIEYASSTAYRMADAAAGNPWPDPLPFPVQVVASTTTLDSMGHAYLTRYRYHDAYYDPEEKQFRGFGRVEQIDTGDVNAPTLVTRSHFDTGRDFEVMKGKLLRITSETEDGKVFQDQTTDWVHPPRVLYSGTNAETVYFVHPVSTVTRVLELGQGTEKRMEQEMEFDAFGNQTLAADYGIVENGDRSAFDDERITTTQYAINTNAWILRLPARVEIKDEGDAVISRSEFFYDEPSFSGDNLGIVNVGNLTMKREWIWPATNSAYITSARTRYDAYGNPVAILDPLADPSNITHGHARQIEYDARFNTYPVMETIHLGDDSAPLVFRAAYDEGFGTVASSTDFNANTTFYRYDPFARLIGMVKPGDSADYPTIEYDYALAVSAGENRIVNYVETRQLDKVPQPSGSKREHYFITRQFVDGLGRTLLTKTEAEPEADGGAPRVVVTEASLFNARQKPFRVLNPFFTLTTGSLDQLLAYEDIHAPAWKGQFHAEGVLTNLNLAEAHSSSTDYDATLRPVRMTNPDRTFRSTVYEPLLTRSFDENDADPTSQYFATPMVHRNDGLGRLVQVDEIARLTDDGNASAEANTWTTRYAYDLNDQLARITDSQNNVKTFSYDGLKRKIHLNDPDRGEMQLVYDDASNLTETTDAKGQVITYTYDGANRIRTENYHDGTPQPGWRSTQEGQSHSVIYHYDTPFPNLVQGDNTTATARNTKGAVTWVEDLSGEEHTSYDSRGRVEWVVKRIPDPLLASKTQPSSASLPLVSFRTGFAYDSLDRLTRLTYPDSDQLRYEYNDRNLVRRIPGGPSGSIISDILYPPSGQMAQIDYGNGVRTTYAYDSRLRLEKLLTASHSGNLNQQLIHFGYDFDGVSNIKAISDLRPGTAVPEGDPRRNTQQFQYDDLYRLTRVQYSFSLPGAAPRNDGEVHYRYDRIGNMLSQTSTFTDHVEKGLPVADLGEMDTGGALGRFNRMGRKPTDPPGPHALTGIRHSSFEPREYAYDANGNMLDIDGLRCTWDFKDRLIAVESAEMRAVYSYDYTDRRIAKDVSYKPGSVNFTDNEARITTLYINKYFEVREHDAPTKYVWNGDTRIARVTGSLNTNARVQRLRVHSGWNLCSLAVSSGLPLLGEGRADVLTAAFRWNPAAANWLEILADDTLPAGTVLWLKASTNATLAITGTYTDPTNRTVPAGGDFLPSAGLEAWEFKAAVSNLPSATAWTYDAFSTHWLAWLPPPLTQQSDLPTFIAPGEAVFVRADTPAQLE